MKKSIFLFICIAVITTLIGFLHRERTEKVIGVIVPMEHQALTEIVKGLRERLPYQIKVLNAQGDPNLQRAMIEQLVRDKCDVIVPIGTSASQMTLSLAKDRRIVCLAAEIKEKSSRIACLHDQLSAHEALHFLKTAFPKIQKITLLYSSSEKVAHEIPNALEAAQSAGIEVQKLMVQTMPELYTIGQAIAHDSQAIFILKDHLIVSGIQTIAQQAERRKIPLMTSDEGSIIAGGAFAIGVKESDIGRQGASIIQNILSGVAPQEVGLQIMQGPFPLFVNYKACQKQGVNLFSLRKAAEELGYSIEFVDQEGQ